MERNSLGQVVVKENTSAIISIPCKENFITIDQYKRFLLDNKEFTELTPTIDKDALIESLTNDLTYNQNLINQLTIDSKRGFLISVTENQFAYPVSKQDAKMYNGLQVYENIGFNDDSTPPNFNSHQTNGLQYWSIPNKSATVYQDANSRSFYNLKATIKYRIKYIGASDVDNIDHLNTKLQFWTYQNGTSNGIGNGVTRNDVPLSTRSYSTGDVSETFTIGLNDSLELGIDTNTIYLPVKFDVYKKSGNNNIWSTSDFLMEILPGSTFSLLPN